MKLERKGGFDRGKEFKVRFSLSFIASSILTRMMRFKLFLQPHSTISSSVQKFARYSVVISSKNGWKLIEMGCGEGTVLCSRRAI